MFNRKYSHEGSSLTRASCHFLVCSLKFVFKLSSRLLLSQHSDGPPPSLPRLDPYADERWSRLSGHSLHQSNHFDVRIYFASLHFHQTYAPDSLLTIFLPNQPTCRLYLDDLDSLSSSLPKLQKQCSWSQFSQKFCTCRFTSADYIGPVDSRGMVIDKEVSVKICEKIMTKILIPSTPKTSVISPQPLEHHKKLCFQVYRQVFRNAKLAKREGVSVGHFVDTRVKVAFLIQLKYSIQDQFNPPRHLWKVLGLTEGNQLNGSSC